MSGYGGGLRSIEKDATTAGDDGGDEEEEEGGEAGAAGNGGSGAKGAAGAAAAPAPRRGAFDDLVDEEESGSEVRCSRALCAPCSVCLYALVCVCV